MWPLMSIIIINGSVMKIKQNQGLPTNQILSPACYCICGCSLVVSPSLFWESLSFAPIHEEPSWVASSIDCNHNPENTTAS